MTRSDRLALIDHDESALPVVAQCRLLKVARSTLYYQPVPVSADDLAVMRRMDERKRPASHALFRPLLMLTLPSIRCA
jgi:hypothetical protein